VHHIDLDPTNNADTNLVVVSENGHGRLHYYLQLALVKLLEPSDLINLTHYLIELIESDKNWKPASEKPELKRELK
jgi:hypothetical protein